MGFDQYHEPAHEYAQGEEFKPRATGESQSSDAVLGDDRSGSLGIGGDAGSVR